MLDKSRFWWLALRRGAGSLNSAAGWLGLTVLLLGIALGIAAPLVFHVSHWLTAVILMAVVLIAVLEGTYRVWAATDGERRTALANSATPNNGVTFWDVKDATLAGNEITNTYNVPQERPPSSKLVMVAPGSEASRNLITIKYGEGAPAAPVDPFPSTREERIQLSSQLMGLADKVEAVMRCGDKRVKL